MSALLLVPDQPLPSPSSPACSAPSSARTAPPRDISKINTGIASIVGAATLDGIVLSGIVPAYLA